MANIEIQNLPSASSPLNGGAYAIIKDGLQDKKATITQLREIDVSAFSSIVTPNQSDLIVVGKGSDTFRTNFSNVGFITGTRCWFYANVAPVGWSIVAGISDCLLGVASNGIYNPAGSMKGNWQQVDYALTVDQIPAHTHLILKTKRLIPNDGSSNALGPLRGNKKEDDSDVNDRYATSDPTGGGQGHNHGNTWRPLAAVGYVCSKD